MIDVACFAAGVLLAIVLAHLHARGERAAHETERREWRRERGVLLNRIKPETAQPVDDQPLGPVLAVDEFSDEDYWKARGIEWEPDAAPN
jgi:hypothetical protein